MVDGDLPTRVFRLEKDVDKLGQRLDAYTRADIFEIALAGIKEDVRQIRDGMQRLFWAVVVAVLGVASNVVVFFVTRPG